MADVDIELFPMIERAVRKVLRGLFPQKRAISMPNVYALVYAQLDSLMQADGVWRALIDVYLEGNAMYAVIGVDGLLYKSSLAVTNGVAVLGAPEQVEVDYKPVAQQRSLTVLRQADGKYRWFAFPAATAVLNRSGELDSRELYNSFVQRIESGEAPYPYLSFYHVGERIVLGQADFAAVEDYEYLLSGLFGEDALAQAARKAVEDNPGYYGLSIGFYYMQEAVDKLVLTDGISIPVYNDGINHEVSLLAETDAACLYTGIFVQKEGVNRMNKKTLDELTKLAGDDPEAIEMVDALAEKVDTINEDIAAKNLIRREQEATIEEVSAPEATVVPEVQPEAEFEMDEATMEALAERVAVKVSVAQDAHYTTLETALAELQTKHAAEIVALTDRVAKLETPLETQVQQALEDMPRVTAKILYRPRERQAEQPEAEAISLEELANETLAILK